MNSIATVWLLLTLVFSGVAFIFIDEYMQRWAIVTVAVSSLTWLSNRLLGALLTCCVARGNTVQRPRILLLCDLVLSLTLGASAGLTTGIVRFAMGVVWLMFKMTLLARPLLPASAARYDPGFMSYGGMMKTSWAWKLSPHSHPTETDGV